MKELKENLEPLNQRAKTYLLEVKEFPEPCYLYCLQLALWGLEKGDLDIDSRIKESLPIMLVDWEPGKTMELLEGRLMYSDDPDEICDLLGGNETPGDLAWSVLDRLRDILGPGLGLNPLR
jgi:hypothetical protein